MTVDFARPLGAGMVARHQLCRDGEQLLWATYGRVFYFDVRGLDPLGKPSKSLLNRGARALGRGVGEFVVAGIDAFLLESNTADDDPPPPPPPDYILFGPRAGCLAHEAASQIGGVPGERATDRLVWALTSARLVVAGPRPLPKAEQTPWKERSRLGRAAEVGKGIAKIGKGVVGAGVAIVKIATDTYTHTYGSNTEGEAVVMPDLMELVEFPREQITSVELAERSEGTCMRVSLADDSGVDFVMHGNETPHRAMELTSDTR